MRTTVVVNCDICKKALSGGNTDGWSGKLPMPAAAVVKNPKLKRPKYSITHTDLCFPCMTLLGDWIQASKK
jgi:hypothetical protein